MERGIVKWFSEEKGYGFIEIEGKKGDYFIHRSNVEDLEGTLETGQRVEFEVAQGKKGPEAINVRLLDTSV